MKQSPPGGARWLEAKVIDVASGRRRAVLLDLEPSALPGAGDTPEVRR